MNTTHNRQRPSYHVGNLRPQLLDAARQMLSEVGPAKLSLRAVSERVGVSATAAYHHFQNRAELVGHLAAQGFCELAQALKQSDSVPLEQKFRQATLAYFHFARANPALYQLMFGAEASADGIIPALQEARDRAFAELRHINAQLLQRDSNSPEVNRASLAGWSYTHGLTSLVIHNLMSKPEGMPDERFVDTVLEGFNQLLKAQS